MTDSKKSEMEIRDKAILHQQRRLKQATQFMHKDSADLLPLDGLKRLGTTKDLQPHSIVQRRLLEGNVTRLRGESRDLSTRVRSPLAEEKEDRGAAETRTSTEEKESPEEGEIKEVDAAEETGTKEEKREREMLENTRKEEGQTTEDKSKSLEALVVCCKCCDKELKATINTGHQHNFISQSCCRQLGLRSTQESGSHDQSDSGLGLPSGMTLAGVVENLELQLGKEKVECSAHVVEDNTFELCLGLQTLLNLKCCLDLHTGVLKLSESNVELPFLESPREDHNDII
ncbi:NRIP3 protein, partial [Atractosteus spatula]|nr:NRIP3 protein [Atractosteus spatula]